MSRNSSRTPDRQPGQVGITTNQITDLLNIGGNAKALAGLSEKDLTDLGDNTKAGETLTELVRVRNPNFVPQFGGSGNFAGNPRNTPFIIEEQSTGRTASQFSATDVDAIIQAFGARQEQVRRRTEAGGRANSVLGGFTSLLSGNTRSS